MKDLFFRMADGLIMPLRNVDVFLYIHFAPPRVHKLFVEEGARGRVDLRSGPPLAPRSGYHGFNTYFMNCDNWDAVFHYCGDATSLRRHVAFTRIEWITNYGVYIGRHGSMTWCCAIYLGTDSENIEDVPMVRYGDDDEQ